MGGLRPFVGARNKFGDRVDVITAFRYIEKTSYTRLEATQYRHEFKLRTLVHQDRK